MIKVFARKMPDSGIRPELEVFDPGMINYAHYFISKGLVTPPFYFNLILGNIASAQANLLSLGLMIKELPRRRHQRAGRLVQPRGRNLSFRFAGGERAQLRAVRREG